MKNVMGIINLMEDEEFLKEISHHRPAAAVPFGGRYRMIDFVLSNMVNSGIRNVGIIVQHKYRALMDHLGNGKEWDLDRKRDGLFYLPPGQGCQQGSYRWDLRHFHTHLDYLQYSRQKYILISGSNMICNIDYRDAFQFHQAMNADITILYKDMENTGEDLSRCHMVETAEDGRIIDLEINPNKMRGSKMSMEMCIMEKSLLVELIHRCYSRGECDLVRDGFIRNLNRLRIYGFPYQGYLAHIDSIQSYYNHSMELLRPEIWQQLFFDKGLIITKVKDGAPTKYSKGSRVHNALIANGCIIEGTVENSIIFRGVKIGQGAHIKDSIIMQKCKIEEGALVENVIADKEVTITKGKHLKGEKNYPMVIMKKTVI
ncbi:glucose-1-phosphate adenylyltransferase subunit GlgD [Desulforamulus putei]|uniref:Glucose-1-phosphate adenylyltransferase n=1 Tax=Desulforamulus putei DSM 12395 TaxID=1121429 RepID=A0A1M4SCN3_9FIRM|nr:glucose-1-phosphate adenylyltransferase subunit GlgD [Desulforamulus putei]SHE29959.1 glucose-1-phosphate adenylyltransferase [Desulforamulus putei DSM 12395]